MTEQPEGTQSSTDEEARHRRYGELPPRVRPEDRVELTETEPRGDAPPPEPPIPAS
jgi:hypothetical protein